MPIIDRFIYALELIKTPCFNRNDEDLCPSLYPKSVSFMANNAQYVCYAGSILTLLPFLFFPRITLYKSSPNVNTDISSVNILNRYIQYTAGMLNNYPATYYSLKKTSYFKNYLTIAKKLDLDYYMSNELLDHSLLPLSGQIYFDTSPALIRDEARVKRKFSPQRHNVVNLFGDSDLPKIFAFIKQKYGDHVSEAFSAFHYNSFSQNLLYSGWTSKNFNVFGKFSRSYFLYKSFLRIMEEFFNYILVLKILDTHTLKIMHRLMKK